MFRVGPFEGFSNLDLVKSETECARFFLDQHCMRVVLIWIRWSRDKLLSYGHVLTMRFVQHGGDELTVVSIWVQDYDRFLASVRQQGDTAKWFIKVDEICVQLLERTEDVITSITLGWHLPTKTLTQPPPPPHSYTTTTITTQRHRRRPKNAAWTVNPFWMTSYETIAIKCFRSIRIWWVPLLPNSYPSGATRPGASRVESGRFWRPTVDQWRSIFHRWAIDYMGKRYSSIRYIPSLGARTCKSFWWQ